MLNRSRRVRKLRRSVVALGFWLVGIVALTLVLGW